MIGWDSDLGKRVKDERYLLADLIEFGPVIRVSDSHLKRISELLADLVEVES